MSNDRTGDQLADLGLDRPRSTKCDVCGNTRSWCAEHRIEQGSPCCTSCSHDRRKNDLVAILIPREWARRWANDELWTPDDGGHLSDYRKAENVIIEGARHALGLDEARKEGPSSHSP